MTATYPKLRVLIADDEQSARDLLVEYLNQVDTIEVVGLATSGIDALSKAKSLAPDLAILDINMPDLGGIETAFALVPQGADIIFVTAHEQYALNAFEVGALDYILKPPQRVRLLQAIERAWLRNGARAYHAEPGKIEGEHEVGPSASENPAGESVFWCPTRDGLVKVAACEIIRVEAARDYVYLHTGKRDFLIRSTMQDVADQLSNAGLTRVHRSALVRLGVVAGIRRRGKSITLTLNDGTLIPVGPRYRQSVLAGLRSLIA